MKEIKFEKITKNLLETFVAAGKMSLNLRDKGLITKIKSDNTPVTNGDLKVNEKLCNKIKSITPDIPIISEETVEFNKKIINKNFWLVDPIDGTKDYMNNKNQFTLNAALIINFEPDSNEKIQDLICRISNIKLSEKRRIGNAVAENIIKYLQCAKKKESN